MVEHGTFMWNQLVTTDQKKSGDFYCELLGWSRREVPAGPFGMYTIFHQDGKDVGGMMNPTTDYSRSRPSWWQAFIAVADVLMFVLPAWHSSAALLLSHRMIYLESVELAWLLIQWERQFN
jgi:hypothetical protein